MCEIGLSWGALGRQLWAPIVATLAMTATVLLLRWGLSEWEYEFTVGPLVLLVCAGAVSYSTVLLGSEQSIRTDIKEVLGWVLRGRPQASVIRP